MRKTKYWNLNSRSWYLYFLNQANHAAFLPAGRLEKLPNLPEIAKAQASGPNFLRLPSRLQSRFPKVGRKSWVTAAGWKKLAKAERAKVLEIWFRQNKLHSYSSVPFSALPNRAQAELKRIQFHSLLNTYNKTSGPNCLATVAAAVTLQIRLRQEWMLWPQLKKILQTAGYRKIQTSRPEPRDVLIFSRESQILHAAYYLGQNLYFEMPGQDFYEPYRIARLTHWRREWPATKLQIWRKII